MSVTYIPDYRAAVIDKVPPSHADRYESIFSKIARKLVIRRTWRNNMAVLSELEPHQLADIGVGSWQINELSRKSAENPHLEHRNLR